MRLTQAEVVCDEFMRNEMYLLGMIILIYFFSFEKKTGMEDLSLCLKLCCGS